MSPSKDQVDSKVDSIWPTCGIQVTGGLCAVFMH